MNSLEFIEKEIQYWQKTINTARSEKLTQTIIVSLNPLYKVENATLSDNHILLIEEKLQTLQKIKSELEAWYVVKDKVEIKRTEVFDHVLRIKQGKGALTHEEFRPLKNLIRVGDK